MTPVVATYSIAACDLDAGQWGVATQSKFLAVGSIVPWAKPRVGAIATQAYANARYGPDGLRLLAEGLGAEEVVAHLTAADDGRDHRQLGVVDGAGGSASYTGAACMSWAGGISGPCFAAQGNILVSQETVDELARAFTTSAGKPLAERLHGCHETLFGKTPARQWIEVDDGLRAELRERLGRLGYESDLDAALRAWAGAENLDERLDGIDRIDPVVLEQLRQR